MAFVWGPLQAEAFTKVKEYLTSENVVTQVFSSDRRTELITDASRLHGLGYCLVQYEPGCPYPKIVQCGSRSLTSCETRYATIELEALGVAYGLNKCQFYLKGLRNFTVMTDHKPLIGIFAKEISDIDNPRLQRIRMKTMAFTFSMIHIPGKLNVIADALSRAPVFAAHQDASPEALTADLAELQYMEEALSVVQDAELDDTDTCQELIDFGLKDAEYQSIIARLHYDKAQEGLSGSPYRPIIHRLSLAGPPGRQAVLLDGDRLVVPANYAHKLLGYLHMAHSGCQKMKMAAAHYFWPNMSEDITNLVRTCKTCITLAPSQPVEKAVSPRPRSEFPMDALGADLCNFNGKDYLVAVDRYSGWPFVALLKKTDTATVTTIMTDWFDTFGWPTRIRTDNGPQFRSEFASFCASNGIKHETSSPYNAQSNGLAEAAVKNVKAILNSSDLTHQKFKTALTTFRNTPRHNGASPAQLFLGRSMRQQTPILRNALRCISDSERKDFEARRAKDADKTEKQMNSHARHLSSLSLGEKVVVQNAKSKKWTDIGHVSDVRESGHSFLIKFLDGSAQVRNRRHIKPLADSTVKHLAPEDQSIPSSPAAQSSPVSQAAQAPSASKPPVRRSPRFTSKPQANTLIVLDPDSDLDPSWASSKASPSRNKRTTWLRCHPSRTNTMSLSPGDFTLWKSTGPLPPSASSWGSPCCSSPSSCTKSTGRGRKAERRQPDKRSGPSGTRLTWSKACFPATGAKQGPSQPSSPQEPSTCTPRSPTPQPRRSATSGRAPGSGKSKTKPCPTSPTTGTTAPTAASTSATGEKKGTITTTSKAKAVAAINPWSPWDDSAVTKLLEKQKFRSRTSLRERTRHRKRDPEGRVKVPATCLDALLEEVADNPGRIWSPRCGLSPHTPIDRGFHLRLHYLLPTGRRGSVLWHAHQRYSEEDIEHLIPMGAKDLGFEILPTTPEVESPEVW